MSIILADIQYTTITENTSVLAVPGKQYFYRNTGTGTITVTYGSDTVDLEVDDTVILVYDGSLWSNLTPTISYADLNPTFDSVTITDSLSVDTINSYSGSGVTVGEALTVNSGATNNALNLISTDGTANLTISDTTTTIPETLSRIGNFTVLNILGGNVGIGSGVDNGTDLIQAGADTDVSFTFGRGKMGYGGSGYSDQYWISHLDAFSVTNVMARQTNSGLSILNGVGHLYLRESNDTKIDIESDAITLSEVTTIGPGLNNTYTTSAYSISLGQIIHGVGSGEADLTLIRDDTTISSGDVLGGIFFKGLDGGEQFGARIRGVSNQSWGSGSSGADLYFETYALGTKYTPMILSSDAITMYEPLTMETAVTDSEHAFDIQDSNAGSRTTGSMLRLYSTSSTSGEASLAFQNVDTDTESSRWYMGINQSSDFSLAYGADFSNANEVMRVSSDNKNVSVGAILDDGVNKLQVYGSAANNTGVWTTLSDIRLKENITEVSNAKSKVTLLASKVKHFNFKEGVRDNQDKMTGIVIDDELVENFPGHIQEVNPINEVAGELLGWVYEDVETTTEETYTETETDEEGNEVEVEKTREVTTTERVATTEGEKARQLENSFFQYLFPAVAELIEENETQSTLIEELTTRIEALEALNN